MLQVKTKTSKQASKKRKLNTLSLPTGSKQARNFTCKAVILRLPMCDWKQQELWCFYVNDKQSFVLIFFLNHFIPQGPSGSVAPAIE